MSPSFKRKPTLTDAFLSSPISCFTFTTFLRIRLINSHPALTRSLPHTIVIRHGKLYTVYLSLSLSFLSAFTGLGSAKAQRRRIRTHQSESRSINWIQINVALSFGRTLLIRLSRNVSRILFFFLKIFFYRTKSLVIWRVFIPGLSPRKSFCLKLESELFFLPSEFGIFASVFVTRRFFLF